MSDAPPRRPFVLTADHLKALRWEIEHTRKRGGVMFWIDLPMLDALVKAADPQESARAYYSAPPPKRRPFWQLGRR